MFFCLSIGGAHASSRGLGWVGHRGCEEEYGCLGSDFVTLCVVMVTAVYVG